MANILHRETLPTNFEIQVRHAGTEGARTVTVCIAEPGDEGAVVSTFAQFNKRAFSLATVYEATGFAKGYVLAMQNFHKATPGDFQATIDNAPRDTAGHILWGAMSADEIAQLYAAAVAVGDTQIEDEANEAQFARQLGNVRSGRFG